MSFNNVSKSYPARLLKFGLSALHCRNEIFRFKKACLRNFVKLARLKFLYTMHPITVKFALSLLLITNFLNLDICPIFK